MKNKKKIKLILILTIVLILIDQISKILIRIKYTGNSSESLIKIELIKNTGMAFGLNNGNTKNIILTGLILIFLIRFVITQIEFIDKKTAIAISLMLAGGISNFIDRIILRRSYRFY